MKKPRHGVSDHALLRYLERKEGLQVEDLRRQLAHELDRAYDAMGIAPDMSPSMVHMGGLSFAVEDFTCVTVFDEKRSNRKPRR